MLNVDTAIVEVALPSIERDMSVSLNALSWVANGYVLAFGGFLLLGGRLGDLLGRRRVFTTGLLLFAAASLLGSLATSSAVLIAARAGQGLAAAIISPTALSLLMSVFPDDTPTRAARRGKALAILGAFAATGGSAGYFLGGALCDVLGWPAVFVINVPLAAAAALCTLRLFPPDPRGTRRRGFGATGAVLVSAGMTLLVYVLVDANTAGWTRPRTLVLAALSAALLTAFLAVQRISAEPLVPLRLFTRPSFRGATAVALLSNAAIGPVIFFLSLYIQQILGFSPWAAGLALVPLIAAVTLSSSLAGLCLRQYSQRAVMATGLALFAVGLLWLGQLDGGAYAAQLLLPECLIGFGGGLVFVTFTVAGTSGQAEQDSGAASAVLTTAQKIGASVGLAVLTGIAGGSTASGPDPHDTAAVLRVDYGSAITWAAAPVLLALAATWAWISGHRPRGVQPPMPPATPVREPELHE